MSILAAVTMDLPKTSRLPGLVASDLIFVLGLTALVFGGLISWVVFVRGPRKHPSENRTFPKASASVTVADDGRERHRKKRRTRRRDHRQRNPTLSQTGGLPPPRDAEESPTI